MHFWIKISRPALYCILWIFLSGTLAGAHELNLKKDFSLVPSRPLPKTLCSIQNPETHFHGDFQGSLFFGGGEGISEPGQASEPSKKKIKLFRATLEYFGLLAYSWPDHWKTYPERKEEWAYGWTWKDQLKRTFTFDAWRFDCNSFFTNYRHSVAGALYHTIARSNNMSVGQSLLFTTAGSLFWEYVPEWRQVLAINDVLYNIVGALTLGELWFQTGKYFLNKKGFVYRVLGFLNPITKVNNFLDGKGKKPWREVPDSVSNFFDLYYGRRYLRPRDQQISGSTSWIGLETSMRSFPDFSRPGHFTEWLPTVSLAEGRWSISRDDEGVLEANIRVLVQLFSLVKQNIDESRRGSSLSFGLCSAFTYYRLRPVAFYDSHQIRPRHGDDLHLEEPRDFKDKYSAVHLAGPRIEYTRYMGDFQFRLSSAAFLDFALVNAFALNPYSENHDISGAKTNLLYFGYYYAWGATLNSSLRFSYKNLVLDGRMWLHLWDSIEGRDRFQDEILDDFDIDDQRLRWTMDLKYTLPWFPVGMLLRYEIQRRSGKIRDVKRSDTFSRWAGGLLVRF